MEAVPLATGIALVIVTVLPHDQFCHARSSLSPYTTRSVPIPRMGRGGGAAAVLVLRLSTALRAPIVVGRNITLMAQLAPGDTVDGLSGQEVVRAKSPGLAPARLMPPI